LKVRSETALIRTSTTGLDYSDADDLMDKGRLHDGTVRRREWLKEDTSRMHHRGIVFIGLASHLRCTVPKIF
jgi:hypothetical protein